MATILDISIFQQVNVLFAVVFIWIIVFAVLSYTKILGEDQKYLNSLLALVIAALTLFTPELLIVLQIIIPWFIFAIILVVLVLAIFKTVGFGDDFIQGVITGKDWSGVIGTWVIIISLLIVLGGIGLVFFSGEKIIADAPQTPVSEDLHNQTPEEIRDRRPGALLATIFHPKILGFIVVMIIGFLCANQLGKGSLM